MKSIVLIIFCAILLPCCFDGTGDFYAKYDAQFRGEWIRMDTGELWYISANSIAVNGEASALDVTLERTSANVVTAQTGNFKYTLFASRVANASFNAQVVFLDGAPAQSLKVSRDLWGSDGQSFIVRPRNQPDLEQIVEADPETGEIKVEGVIPGDTVDIIPVDSEWNNIKVGLTPGYGEDQNMGVIPITLGDNFKVSVRMQDPAVDITGLYADMIPRRYIFELENIGKTNSGDTGWEITWDPDDFVFISGSKREDFANIAPGGKRQLVLELASKSIETQTKRKEININIKNYISSSMQIKEWNDTVSINYHNIEVAFNFRSEKEVQGIIKSQKGKSYYFKTGRPGDTGDYSATVYVPWSEEEYIVAFLGASIELGSATKYSIGIEALPPNEWGTFNIWSFLEEYKPANTFESTAPVINLSDDENTFMGYLAGDSIDYYRIRLGGLTEMREKTISFHPNGGTGAVPPVTADYLSEITLPGPGDLIRDGFIFDRWNTDEYGSGHYYEVNYRFLVTGNITLYAVWILVEP
ncbi:MAG: InlB B-repeat-containing protein [Treponema sp.]|nr:InlB B-repeat-containing protein [Treponema sp.]